MTLRELIFEYTLPKILGVAVILAVIYLFWTHYPTPEEVVNSLEQKERDRISSARFPDQVASDPAKLKDKNLQLSGVVFSEDSTRAYSNVLALFQSLDPKSEWTVHRNEQGYITQISGGKIQLEQKGPESRLNFAKQIVAAMGIESENLDFSSTQLQETSLSRPYQISHFVEDYEVLNSYLKIFESRKDNAIYFVTNETKNLGPVDTRIDVSLDRAVGLANTAFADKSGVVVQSAAQKPVVYNVSPGESYLVWKLIVDIQAPLVDKREVFVSTKDGRIIRNESIVIN
jgi:Zn-dependent metalloprotease